jgi:hypothetical protein
MSWHVANGGSTEGAAADGCPEQPMKQVRQPESRADGSLSPHFPMACHQAMVQVRPKFQEQLGVEETLLQQLSSISDLLHVNIAQPAEFVLSKS